MSVAASCVEVNVISMVGSYRFTPPFTISNQGPAPFSTRGFKSTLRPETPDGIWGAETTPSAIPLSREENSLDFVNGLRQVPLSA